MWLENFQTAWGWLPMGLLMAGVMIWLVLQLLVFFYILGGLYPKSEDNPLAAKIITPIAWFVSLLLLIPTLMTIFV